MGNYIKKFRPEPYSQGPYARAVHDGGGKLIYAPLNKQKFDSDLSAHAPGCGSSMHVAGTNGGQMRCGGTLRGEVQLCDACSGVRESADSIVQKLIGD